jgi:aflatoxin B1 aldehyde reductase
MAGHLISPAGLRSLPMEQVRLPEIYLGTMTFGWNQASSSVDEEVARNMLNLFISKGGVQVDTARIYSAGETEVILGKVMKDLSLANQTHILGTKVHPSQPAGLSKKGIRDQFSASLKALQVGRVDVLYLHQPDPDHDLAESLLCVQELLQEGLISKYGLSNYSALEVERLCSMCLEKGWPLPSFYQGLYNPLNRLVEIDLLPVLRKNNISFVAYNPLAAGMLTGKHKSSSDVFPGRFKNNPNYLPRFYTEPNFRAVVAIEQACQEANLTMVAATYAWLLCHSQLSASAGDGLLIGASSLAQLEENLTACHSASTLPAAVASAFDTAWEITGGAVTSFPYWRSYSRDQPGREVLPPGASYSATKK